MKEYGSKYVGDDSITMISESSGLEEYLFYTGQYQEPELAFLQKATIEYRRSAWPRRCCVSKRLLWWKVAVRARRLFYGLAGDSPMLEDRWYDCNEYLMLKLKGQYGLVR
jgi:hypothetical protein